MASIRSQEELAKLQSLVYSLVGSMKGMQEQLVSTHKDQATIQATLQVIQEKLELEPIKIIRFSLQQYWLITFQRRSIISEFFDERH